MSRHIERSGIAVINRVPSDLIPTSQATARTRRCSGFVIPMFPLVLFGAATCRGDILAGPIINPANGHTYYLLTQSTWTTAEAEAVGLCGHLATINDDAENAWVLNTFSRIGGTTKTLWIGLNDAAQEGRFVWSSGQPVTYTHWSRNEPSNGGGIEDYTHIYDLGRGGFASLWNDYCDCTAEFGVPLHGVVEVGIQIQTQPVPQPTCRDGTARFTVVAVPGPYQYAWRKDAVVLADQPGHISGASTASLTVVHASSADVGVYDCLVSDNCASTTSLAVPLRICVAELDDGSGTGACDGGVTIDDLLYYISLYAAGVPRADVDDGTATNTPDGGVTIDDLLYYLQRFDAGC